MNGRGVIVSLALGLLVLFVLRLIPLVGWIIGLIVIVFGLGTLVTSIRTVRLESVESD